MKRLKVITVIAAPLKKKKQKPKSLVKRKDAFWESMSRDEQEQYLEEHPNSKYKDSPLKPKGGQALVNQGKAPGADIPQSEKPKKKLTDVIKDWHEEQKKFFEEGQHQPESEERNKIASLLERKKKGLHKSIKNEVKEWKVATNALRKLKNGQGLDEHDKEAMKAIAVHSGIVMGDLALTGGLASSVAAAISAMAGGMLSHSLMIHFGKAAVYSAKSKHQSDDELLEEIIQHFIDGVKKAPLPAEDWVKAFEGVNKNANSKQKKK